MLFNVKEFMKMRVLITNKSDAESHVQEVASYTDAKHWIINHLDTSKHWQVQDITSASVVLKVPTV